MYLHSHRFALIKLSLSKYIFVTLGGSNNQKTKLYNMSDKNSLNLGCKKSNYNQSEISVLFV